MNLLLLWLLLRPKKPAAVVGALSHLDLPPEIRTSAKSYWVSELYGRDPKRGVYSKGFTPMRLQTYRQHFDQLFDMQPKPAAKVTWVWYGGQWVRA